MKTCSFSGSFYLGSTVHTVKCSCLQAFATLSSQHSDFYPTHNILSLLGAISLPAITSDNKPHTCYLIGETITTCTLRDGRRVWRGVRPGSSLSQRQLGIWHQQHAKRVSKDLYKSCTKDERLQQRRLVSTADNEVLHQHSSAPQAKHTHTCTIYTVHNYVQKRLTHK